MEPKRDQIGEYMATNFTLKNIPEDIYEKIKVRAERNHRSINGEIISILSETVRPRSKNAAEILARADELRSHTRGFVTDEFISRAKREGRP
jgi:plasmid stability protein